MPLRYTLFLFLVLSGCASLTPATEDDVADVEAVEEHGLTKDQAFTRLMRWTAETYNSANDVIQLSDPDDGAIVVRGAHKPVGSTQLMYYAMTMDVRDGRVRFRQRLTDSEGSAGAFDFISKADAAKLAEHFDALRSSALVALAEDDDF